MKFKIPVIIAFAALSFTACQQEDLPPASKPEAALNVINLTGTEINVRQNGNRINTTSTIYAGGVTGYLVVTAGETPFAITRNGTPEVLAMRTLTLDSNSTNTLFIAGFGTDETIFTNDAFTPDTANRAQLRLVNVSPQSSAITMLINDTTVFDGVNYKAVAGFTGFNSGRKEVKVQQNNVTLYTDSVTLVRGNGYTFFAKGDPAKQGDAGFDVQVFRNN